MIARAAYAVVEEEQTADMIPTTPDATQEGVTQALSRLSTVSQDVVKKVAATSLDIHLRAAAIAMREGMTATHESRLRRALIIAGIPPHPARNSGLTPL